jgi:transposase
MIKNTLKGKVFDIPEIKPYVTEYRQIVGICEDCGNKNVVDFPESVNSGVQIGANALSIMGYFNVKDHLSYERIRQTFKDIFNFEISEGTIDFKIKDLEKKLTPTYNNILEALKKSEVVGSDETGTKVKKENWQQWVFQNEDFSYFKTAKSRGFDVIEGLFGKKFNGGWISDRLGSQLKIEADHQLCAAHLIRNCQYAIDAEQSEWAKELKQVLEDGIKLRNNIYDFNPCCIEEFRGIQKIKERLNRFFK